MHMRGKASDGVLRTHITLRPYKGCLRRKHGALQQLCPDHAICASVNLFKRVPLWRATEGHVETRARTAETSLPTWAQLPCAEHASERNALGNTPTLHQSHQEI